MTELRTWTSGSGTIPVVLLHGGPGIPDYLAPVAAILDDVCRVHRYDQRGTGGSPWDGEHTIARHVEDLAALIDGWGHDRVVLVGHSYGTDLAGYFLHTHAERVAGLVQIAGPFLGAWQDEERAAQRARRTDEQQARLETLEAVAARTEAEEIEFLTLKWFTDHADRERAWDWALAAARALRPVNYKMNNQLNAAKKAGPPLPSTWPPGAMIIGGAGDTRPAGALRRAGAALGCEVVIIPDAGHHPWREAPARFSTALRTAVLRQAPGHPPS